MGNRCHVTLRVALLTVVMVVPFTTALSLFSQSVVRPLTKRVMVKTNLFNLAVAKRPTLSVEKIFSETFSVEASYVQGRFTRILFTDNYRYNGFLLRAKKYFGPSDYGQVSPFYGVYTGNLKRIIQTKGQTVIPFLLAYPSRDFSANSIRAGGTLGASLTTKSRINIELVMGVGYGRYIRYYSADRRSKGYPDTHIWLSAGYGF